MGDVDGVAVALEDGLERREDGGTFVDPWDDEDCRRHLLVGARLPEVIEEWWWWEERWWIETLGWRVSHKLGFAQTAV